MGILKREELPENISSVIGSSNGTIVYNLVTDVVENSFRQPYAGFSVEVSEALVNLKAFNMTRIYKNPAIERHLGNVRELFIFFLRDILKTLKKAMKIAIFPGFLEDMSENYISAHSKPEIVRDFM